MKAGQIVENYQGKFAKVIKAEGGRFQLSAWVAKKSDAEAETKVVHRLNAFGLSQVLKDGAEAPKEPKESKPEKAEKPKEAKAK